MALHVHICRTDADAETVTKIIKQQDPNANPKKMAVPDLMVFDHRSNVPNPTLLNQNCPAVVVEK